MYPYEIWDPHYRFTQTHCISRLEVEFRSQMRFLWEQHIAWTRMAILSIIYNLPDLDFTIARLLQNVPDMGKILQPFYGSNIAAKYSDLIKSIWSLQRISSKRQKPGIKKQPPMQNENGTPKETKLPNS